MQVKVRLHDLIDAAPSKGNGRAYALACMVFFAVAREGLGVFPAGGVPAAGKGHGCAAGALGCR